jgi:hypothetical protein
VKDWELILARVRLFGFQVCDDGRDMIEVKRDGRTCSIDLVGTVRISANDPRDIWLLKRAIEDGWQWILVETYFVRRFRDGEIMPVELRLGRYHDEPCTPFLDDDGLDGNLERKTIRTLDDLHDALPVLAPSNAIGYHRARGRIFARYDETLRGF